MISRLMRGRPYPLLIITIFLVSFTSDPYIKRISDTNFRYEFYTIKKNIKPKANKSYFWFKGGSIHSAQSGIAGDLLHDKFTKFYHSNQLAEQGHFKNGLKIGIWKSWYENGALETIQNFKSGFLNGSYITFNNKGEIVEKGHFIKGLKNGKWINLERKDTIIYKKGKIFNKKIKPLKETKKTDNKDTRKSNSFFKRIFTNRKNKLKTNDQGT